MLYILFAAALAIVIYVAEIQLYKKKWEKNLKANAYFRTDEAFEGDEAELTETVENAKTLPLPMIKMKLQLSRKLLFRDTDNSAVSDFFNRTDIYSIGPRQRVKRTMKFVCSSRGYYDFNGVDLVGADLFLTKEFVKKIETSSALYVYPRPYDAVLMEPVLNRINGETLTKRNLTEDPFELRGIREYQTFDSLKNVNWKASAKTDDLMVNMHDYTSRRTIRVYLNLENSTIMAHEELMELCISMAMSIIINYAKASVPVSVYANTRDHLTDKPIIIDEGSGESFIRTVNRSFARADLDKERYKFSELFEGYLTADDDAYTVILSPYMQKDFQELLCKLVSKKKDFCWISPQYKNVQFEVMEELKPYYMGVKAEEALYEFKNS